MASKYLKYSIVYIWRQTQHATCLQWKQVYFKCSSDAGTQKLEICALLFDTNGNRGMPHIWT